MNAKPARTDEFGRQLGNRAASPRHGVSSRLLPSPARGKSPNILVEMLRRSAMPDYDYIIGCVMANRLSEDPHAQVLL